MLRLTRSAIKSNISSAFKFNSSRVYLFHQSCTRFNDASPSEETTEKEKEIVQVRVPLVGSGISNIQFNKWHKQVGDQVDYGDLIAELQHNETKLAIDIFSQRRGILKEQLISEGSFVNCGDAISNVEVEKMNEEELNIDMTTVRQDPNQKPEKPSLLSALLDLGVVILAFFSIYPMFSQKEEEKTN